MTSFIGLVGRKNSGKDTVGDYLVKEHGFKRLAFADPVKWVARKLFPELTEAQCWGSVAVKETVDPLLGFTPRWLFQTIGTEVGRMGNLRALEHVGVPSRYLEVVFTQFGICPGPAAWVNALLAYRQSQPGKHIITDVRFPNEAAAILTDKGEVWKLVRPGSDTGAFNDHPSETEVDNCPYGRLLVNDSTIETLQHNALLLLNLEVS